jgi:hypothetical protein
MRFCAKTERFSSAKKITGSQLMDKNALQQQDAERPVLNAISLEMSAPNADQDSSLARIQQLPLQTPQISLFVSPVTAQAH